MKPLSCVACSVSPKVKTFKRWGEESTEYQLICGTCGRAIVFHGTKTGAISAWNELQSELEKWKDE